MTEKLDAPKDVQPKPVTSRSRSRETVAVGDSIEYVHRAGDGREKKTYDAKVTAVNGQMVDLDVEDKGGNFQRRNIPLGEPVVTGDARPGSFARQN